MLFIHNNDVPSEEFMRGLDAEEARLVKYFTPLVVDDSQLAFDFDEELIEYVAGREEEEWIRGGC